VDEGWEGEDCVCVWEVRVDGGEGETVMKTAMTTTKILLCLSYYEYERYSRMFNEDNGIKS
jgi:hypothetical protein